MEIYRQCAKTHDRNSENLKLRSQISNNLSIVLIWEYHAPARREEHASPVRAYLNNYLLYISL